MSNARGSAVVSVLAAAGLAVASVAGPQGPALKPPAMTHVAAGREQCLLCHSGKTPVPRVPVSHRGRTTETCLWCHATDAAVRLKPVPAMAHDPEGFEECLACHAPGAQPGITSVPADHQGRTESQCLWCHRPPAAK